jgi:hypothetical protein
MAVEGESYSGTDPPLQGLVFMLHALSCSVHPPQELTFDKIWDVLGKDHFVNEQQSVHAHLTMTTNTNYATITTGTSLPFSVPNS